MRVRRVRSGHVRIGFLTRRLGLVTLTSLMMAAAHAASPGWRPANNVELIVGTGPGGGTDRTARFIQKIMQDNRLVEAPVAVVNKPGGGGAVALSYLMQRAGDGRYLVVGNPTLLSTDIIGRSPVPYTDVTPVALVGSEYVAFAVKADSPLRTGKDVLDRLKEDPGSLSIAIGAAVGNQNHIAVSLAAKEAGVDIRKLKTVIFKSGGDTVTAILGGHVDVAMTSASSFAAHVKSGALRLVAVAAPKRLSGDLAAVPTWKEQGVNSIAGNWRIVFGPGGMSQAQLAYWDAVFTRLVQTDEWKKDLARNYTSDDYLNSHQLPPFLKAEHDKLRSILTELGLAKQ